MEDRGFSNLHLPPSGRSTASYARDGRRHDLLEHPDVDVRETLQVKASLAVLVLAELLEQCGVALDARHDVEREIRLSRRESYLHPCAGAARTRIVPGAEPDYARSPHLRLRFRHFLHELRHGPTVGARGGVGERLEKLGDAGFGDLGLRFSRHGMFLGG